jgi:hypothetical protein
MYEYPKRAFLVSHYMVKIYDWDHASLPGMKNTKLDASYCKGSIGECNTYVPKFDWYTILTNIIADRSGVKTHNWCE